MQGKTILVTGATDGIGKAAAIKFATAGATVLVHGRAVERCAAAIAEIRAAAPAARPRPLVADFARLDDIRAMVEQVKTEEPRLDVLVNNAGIGIEADRHTTVDGHELAFQVNYLATYLLGTRLAPLMARGPEPGRIVCVSSSSQAPVDFADPDFERGWDGIHAYGRSKWAQACFALAFARRHAPSALTVNALHPGSFMPTKIVLGKFPVQDSIGTGTDSIWRLATDPALAAVTGQYFDRGEPARAIAETYDEAIQERLMALSESMLAETCAA